MSDRDRTRRWSPTGSGAALAADLAGCTGSSGDDPTTAETAGNATGAAEAEESTARTTDSAACRWTPRR